LAQNGTMSWGTGGINNPRLLGKKSTFGTVFGTGTGTTKLKLFKNKIKLGDGSLRSPVLLKLILGPAARARTG